MTRSIKQYKHFSRRYIQLHSNIWLLCEGTTQVATCLLKEEVAKQSQYMLDNHISSRELKKKTDYDIVTA